MGAPLAIGGVHRPTLIGIALVQTLALSIFAAGGVWCRELPRVGLSVVFPLALVAIPLLQSIPLPAAIHARLDPAGVDLLSRSVVPLPAHTPLSLDPPSTRVALVVAASGLATFLIAFHLAAGRRRQMWFPRAVAMTGVLALALGMCHRIFGYTRVYDLVPSTARTLIIGPFVNANHTAELLELAAFASLACAQHRATALNRTGWSVAAVLCLAGTVATLSRGAVAAVGAGLLALFVLRPISGEETIARPRRAALTWRISLALAAVLLAAALGANQLFERFESSATTQDIRFQLWRDSLRVLWAHPFGIGRNAFDRVYPIYRTLKTAIAVRFAFVENEPLQLLIDTGWVLFVVLAAAFLVSVWRLYRRRRADAFEAALVAGLAAVLAHNLVDFGLETAGILLPFMAIFGTVLGRAEPMLQERAWVRRSPIAATCVALLLGSGALARASSDNFDALLRRTRDPAARRDVLARAQAAHPADYFYVLQFAETEPLRPPGPHGPSPRLHALNHALELCPACGAVHQAIAQNLWQLSFRRQALLEWRSTLQLEPILSRNVFEQLYTAGATADQIVAVAATNPQQLMQAADLLNRASRHEQALAVVDRAEQLGAPASETLLRRAELQLTLGKVQEAAATLARAHALGLRDPRLALLDVQLIKRTKGREGADEALAILDAAAARDRTEVPIQRARVELVLEFQKWSAAERALADYREALYRTGGSAHDAYIAAGRIHSSLSHWTQAMNDYRMALVEAPNSVQLWLELGHAAEAAGKISTARDAYSRAARLAPQDASVAKAIEQMDDRRRSIIEPGSPDPAAPQ